MWAFGGAEVGGNIVILVPEGERAYSDDVMWDCMRAGKSRSRIFEMKSRLEMVVGSGDSLQY